MMTWHLVVRSVTQRPQVANVEHSAYMEVFLDEIRHIEDNDSALGIRPYCNTTRRLRCLWSVQQKLRIHILPLPYSLAYASAC